MANIISLESAFEKARIVSQKWGSIENIKTKQELNSESVDIYFSNKHYNFGGCKVKSQELKDYINKNTGYPVLVNEGY